MKRRSLLLAGLAGGGGLLVGWGVLPQRSRLGRHDTLAFAEGEVGLNGWIKIGDDGRVLLAMNRAEMGQGVHTALAMLAAEELDVPLSRVQLAAAGHDTLYGNVAAIVDTFLPLRAEDREPGAEPALVHASRWLVGKVARELGINATGGSSSLADAWEPVRQAAATARGQLLGAASLQWKLPVEELRIDDGVISHPSGPRAHYGSFARAAAATRPGDARPKPRSDWRLIGRAAPRIDLRAKTDGSARFGIDVRLPGMVYAAVRHCPMIGGGAGAVNVDAAMRLPGVERVVRLASYAGSQPALAVVGRSTWHAQRGADALEVEWRQRPAGALDSRAILTDLEQRARSEPGFAFYRQGDPEAALAAAPQRLEAVYRAPYLAHAAMEPINCTARVHDGRVEVWAPTQVPGFARAIAARVAQLPEDAVTVHVTYLGGGFGRRLEVDYVGQAVRIALETGGRPVQLVWSREEDFQHDFYRPAGVAVMRAALDARGWPTALAVTSAGDPVRTRNLALAVPAALLPGFALMSEIVDKTPTEGLFDLPYAFREHRIAHVVTDSGVPVGFWRSVGHSQHAFFAECFMDELAQAARSDPVVFRLALLEHLPRHAAVLKLAAEKAGWPGFGPVRALAKGHALGVALHASFGSIVAQVAEVSIREGRPRVHRVVCAADVGTVVNPGIVAQQIEGAVIFGLTAALFGRIDIEGGVVQQTNFPDHPLLRLADSPQIETHLIASSASPGGVGEPGTPPVAPAVANALFALTGRRLRDLPLAV